MQPVPSPMSQKSCGVGAASKEGGDPASPTHSDSASSSSCSDGHKRSGVHDSATTTTTTTTTGRPERISDSLVEGSAPGHDLSHPRPPHRPASVSEEMVVVVASQGPPVEPPQDEDADLGISSLAGKWRAVRANPNVFRILVFCLLDGGAFSIWKAQVFQVLIKSLGGDPAVGWMSAASGVAQMIAAVLVGFIGERFLRQTVLRCGALTGLIAVSLTLIGLFELRLSVFYVSQVFWGIYAGWIATGTEAIFADSVATGRRSFIYNVKWIDQTLSSMAGILIAVVILVRSGDTWERSSILATMYGGLLLHPLAMAVLFTLKDAYSIADENEEATAAAPAQGTGCHPTATTTPATGGTSDAGAGAAGAAEQLAAVMKSRGLWSGLQPSESRQFLRTGGGCAGAAVAPASAVVVAGEGHSAGGAEEHRIIDVEECEGEGAPVEAGGAGARRASASAAATTATATALSWRASAPASVVGDSHGIPDEMPRGQGERAMMRYLDNQARREHETFLSEQHELAGRPVRRLVNCVRYYMHVSLTWEAVPFFVCLVDFLVAFGSGMTMQFLALYFIENRGTRPSVLLTAHLIVCPVQAFLSHVAQVLGSHYTGRVAATILLRVVGSALMLIMGITHLPLWILIPIYTVRNALMNSTRGVTRSIIMDAVKKENRAKWSAFESFSSFTWAGSAVIGGYIAEAKGYQYSFTVTALFHFGALAVLVPAAIGSFPVEKEMMREARERLSRRKAARKMMKPGVSRAEEVTMES